MIKWPQSVTHPGGGDLDELPEELHDRAQIQGKAIETPKQSLLGNKQISQFFLQNPEKMQIPPNLANFAKFCRIR